MLSRCHHLGTLVLLSLGKIKNSSVAVTTWVVSDIFTSELSETNRSLVAVLTQAVIYFLPLPSPYNHDVNTDRLDLQSYLTSALPYLPNMGKCLDL